MSGPPFEDLYLAVMILDIPLLFVFMTVHYNMATLIYPLWISYRQILVFISLAQWVKLRSTDPQVQSSNTEGTYVLINSGKISKVDIIPKIETFLFHF